MGFNQYWGFLLFLFCPVLCAWLVWIDKFFSISIFTKFFQYSLKTLWCIAHLSRVIFAWIPSEENLFWEMMLWLWWNLFLFLLVFHDKGRSLEPRVLWCLPFSSSSSYFPYFCDTCTSSSIILSASLLLFPRTGNAPCTLCKHCRGYQQKPNQNTWTVGFSSYCRNDQWLLCWFFFNRSDRNSAGDLPNIWHSFLNILNDFPVGCLSP